MASLSSIVLASAIAFSLWKVIRLVLHRLYKSPLRRLPGPRGESLLFGNLAEIMGEGSTLITDKWAKEYGSTLRFKGFLSADQLLTVDTRAVNHMLTHPSDYQKPIELRVGLGKLLGEGLLLSEGTRHRQQRRVMNPAFGPVQIRELTMTFFKKAVLLCDLLSTEIAKDPTATTTGRCIDVVPWLNRVTLDIIGLAGFGYNFNSLDVNGQPNELKESISCIFSANQENPFAILRGLFPVLDIVPSTESRKMQAAQRTMNKIGGELVAKAKAAALASTTEKGETEKNIVHGRDLLTLLVKANMTNTSDSQRLSDKDVLAQVPTFVIAGHETTSTGISWALYAMTQALEVQTKLREEIFSVDTDMPSMDELMALPYLDAVVKETLRVHPPIPATARIAMKDDVIPVEKPYTDRHGVVRDTINICKGDQIWVSIVAMNRSTDLWGPDAHEFKPERWNNTTEVLSQIPGVWAHLLTFSGGPRACIGYRFSVVEIKVILYSLIRAFEFVLAVPAHDIRSRTVVVQRPVLRGDPAHQSQLPLLVKPHYRT